jgi:hypothetical protein
MTDAAEETFTWLKLVTTAVVLGGAAFAFNLVPVRFAAWYLFFLKIEELDIVDGDFLERPYISREFTEALESPYFETVLLYGQRGNGKTTFLQSALKGRRGVLSIAITKRTGPEASTELIEQMSKKVHMFGLVQDVHFMDSVFAACPVPPVVVVSVDSKCKGEVLEDLLITCKQLGYQKKFRKKFTLRIVVDMSGSRAAIETTTQLNKLRVIGVHCRDMLVPEAEMYVTGRLPASLDQVRTASVARDVVATFDGCVLTLQEVCRILRKLPIVSVGNIASTIEEAKLKEEVEALKGWDQFCSSVGVPADSEKAKQVALLLLERAQDVHTLCKMLTDTESKNILAPRDIGVYNAEAGYHPLAIDPFGIDASLSGKATRNSLRKEYEDVG